MACIIPDAIPATATRGERTLFSILRNGLPDDFIVWYEPSISRQYPDFIILGPDFGLLIIEVKGWAAHQIDSADPNQFRIRRKYETVEKVAVEESPLKQAHRYFGLIADKFKQHPVLCNLEGFHQGKLSFPIGQGAVMSNLTESKAKELGVDAILEKPAVAYSDELLEWQNLSDRALRKRLKMMFSVDFPFYALSHEQIDTIKCILHPEVQIRTKPATVESLPVEVQTKMKTKLPPDSQVIVSLDLQQEIQARKLGDGHRLLSGVAGSGKTLILMARAKFLANEFPHYKILVLCYHKSLAGYLRSLIYSDQNYDYPSHIEVLHFNAWAKSILGVLPLPKAYADQQRRHQATGEELVQALNQRNSSSDRSTSQSINQNIPFLWDAILIDEAHTFDPSWFPCCVAALKGGKNGNLLIASDGNQKIYKRGTFTWKSVGVKAQGRTRLLKINYRNTKEILKAAWAVIDASTATRLNADRISDPTFPLIEPKSADKRGPKPVLHLSETLQQSVDIACEQIERFRQVGYETQDIAVIFHSRAKENEDWLPMLRQKLEALDISIYWTSNDYTKRNYSAYAPGVRFVSTESALGLEFKAVVIMEVARFVDRHEDEAIRYRQLYVAMTRAQDELHILGNVSHPFTQTLVATGKFKVNNLKH